MALYLKKATLLIVEDDALNSKMLADALKDDYHIRVAENARQAMVSALEYPRPDLIILDIIMPEMDGFDFCKILKTNSELKDIPVVFITALLKEEDEEKGLLLGAIDYIKKPFNIPVVKARIDNHVELKLLRDMFKESAMIDGLTKIANKKKFDETLQREWKRCLRLQKPLALLMIDIDYFKAYNDTYGHLKGDEALKIIAYALKKQLKRPSDLAARWGGEEFACILPETDPEAACTIGETIRQTIEEIQIDHQNSEVSEVLTVSIGCSGIVPQMIDGWNDLLQKADLALYQAKSGGRNKVVCKK